jgi:hypothetical protein
MLLTIGAWMVHGDAQGAESNLSQIESENPLGVSSPR